MVMERKSELILDRDVSIDRFFEEPVDADAALPILRVWGRRTLKWQLLFGLGLCRVHNFLRRDDPRSCGARWSKFLFQLGVSKATTQRRHRERPSMAIHMILTTQASTSCRKNSARPWMVV